MAGVLLDKTDDAGFENFMSESEKGVALKRLMYSNDNYVKYAEFVFPWLLNRGALES